ncbi:MAG: glycosyl hydrolase family 53 [Planctomycetes bacterium]|nr:glycosyl hydrolase family 53 [Planctomycetota bacterium]
MNKLIVASLLTVLVPALAVAVLADEPAADRPQVAKSPIGFVKGQTWGWWGRRGHYEGPEAAESMRLMAATGTEWATIAFVAHMPAHNIPMIAWGEADPRMVTDDEIRRAIGLARENKLKIILKPVYDCLDGTWRAKIDFRKPDGKTDDAAWNLWWQCYEAFMLHYARLAAEGKCEALVVGCEMTSTEGYEKQWRGLIKKIRDVYDGPLIYNTADKREQEVTWWDAVDVIGVGVYWTVGTKDDSSLETMVAEFRKHVPRLKALSEKWKRPILFIEIGCRSADGCQVWPGDCENWQWPCDLGVQARFYEAALQVFWNEPWLAGYSWWDWPARLYPKDKAATDKQFYIYGKPAEQVLRTWYAKPRP